MSETKELIHDGQEFRYTQWQDRELLRKDALYNLCREIFEEPIGYNIFCLGNAVKGFVTDNHGYEGAIDWSGQDVKDGLFEIIKGW